MAREIGTIWLVCLLALFVTENLEAVPVRVTPDASTLPAVEAENGESTRFAVSGRIVNTAGESVIGAKVLLEVSDMRIRRQIGYDQTETDGEGRYRFDLSAYRHLDPIGLQISTHSPYFRPALTIRVEDRDDLPAEIDLTVQPGAAVAGVVVDEEERPLAGAEVSIPGVDATSTDTRGRFELYGLAVSRAQRLITSAEGYSRQTMVLQPEVTGWMRDVYIVMESARRLEGVVRWPNGGAAKLLSARLHFPERGTLTGEVGEDGAFHFKGAPGTLENAVLQVVTADFGQIRRELTVEEQENRRVEIVVEWPLSLQGIVTTNSGLAMGGVRVHVQSVDGEWRESVLTDDLGQWSIAPVKPGERLRLYAYPPAVDVMRYLGELEIERDDTGTGWKGRIDPWPDGRKSAFVVQLEGNELRMTRHDSGPGAFSGSVEYHGTVDLESGTMKGRVFITSLGVQGEFHAKAYHSSRQLAGTWDLREAFEGGSRLAPSVMEFVSAPLSGRQWLTVRLSGMRTLAGRVVSDGAGALPEGTVVQVIRWNGEPYRTGPATVHPGGFFVLEDIPPGELELLVTDGEGEPLGAPVTVREDDESPVLHLAPERALRY